MRPETCAHFVYIADLFFPCLWMLSSAIQCLHVVSVEYLGRTFTAIIRVQIPSGTPKL